MLSLQQPTSNVLDPIKWLARGYNSGRPQREDDTSCFSCTSSVTGTTDAAESRFTSPFRWLEELNGMTGNKFEQLFRSRGPRTRGGERDTRRRRGEIWKGETRLSGGRTWTIRRVSRAEAAALSRTSRHAAELYKSIARKISPTRFPPVCAVAAPEFIYNSRVTVHTVYSTLLAWCIDDTVKNDRSFSVDVLSFLFREEGSTQLACRSTSSTMRRSVFFSVFFFFLYLWCFVKFLSYLSIGLVCCTSSKLETRKIAIKIINCLMIFSFISEASDFQDLRKRRWRY